MRSVLMSTGASTAEAAKTVGFQSSWVRRCVGRYNRQGPEAVQDGHRHNPGGGKRRLDARQQARLARALEKEPPGGGRWNGPKVAAWIAGETGRRAHPQLGWVYLQRLGLSSQSPRRRHVHHATASERAAFKESSVGS
jgi:transposase